MGSDAQSELPFRIPGNLSKMETRGFTEEFCFCMAGVGPTVCLYISARGVSHTASSLPRTGGTGVKRDRRLAGWTGGSHRVRDKISQQGRERQSLDACVS